MREFRIIYTTISCLIVTATVIIYMIFTPYKIIRKLPQISANQVERVVVEIRKTDNDLLQDSTFDLNSFIKSYNQCRELKSDSGTTYDDSIIIYLKDASRIRVYSSSKDIVFIGFERSDGYYYQANVRSEEIANIISNIRKSRVGSKPTSLLKMRLIIIWM